MGPPAVGAKLARARGWRGMKVEEDGAEAGPSAMVVEKDSMGFSHNRD